MRVSSGNVLIIMLIFMLVATMVVELAASNPATLTETVIKVEPALVEFGNPAGDPIPTPGTQFTVTIKIYNVTNLYGFDLKLRWNTTFLDYVSRSVHVPRDTYLDGVLWNPILQLADEVNATEGTYWIAYASMLPAPSFNGTGTIFTMTFEIIKQPYDYETGGPEIDPIDTVLDFLSIDLAARALEGMPVPIAHSVEPAIIRIWEMRWVIAGTISIAIVPSAINFGENTTISGVISPPCTANITLLYRLQEETVWKNLTITATDPEGKYAYTWTPPKAAVYELNATWLGDPNTLPASETGTLTVNKTIPTITIDVQPTPVTLGSNVTLNVTISPTFLGANININIQYRLQGDANWTALTIVQTDSQGQYSYLWKPDKAGTYELRASWSGDQNTNPAESEPKTVIVGVQPTEAIPYVVAGVITIIIVAAAIYFVKIRKPK
jgi:hypothetical protein